LSIHTLVVGEAAPAHAPELLSKGLARYPMSAVNEVDRRFVGASALAESTLQRRLNGGEPVAQVLQEEWPRWVKGLHGPVAGLVQRRRAELAFARESSPTIRYGEGGAIELKMPYFAQADSATALGPRMCFSPTCAMAAAFLRPGCLAGEGQPDDRYLALVQRYGDSTEAHA
jgi:hypothetical protein